MLAELVELVIGVDTHTDTHTAAVLAADTHAVLATVTVSADEDGYADLVALADAHGGLRGWAIEGTGGYGAGPARHLDQLGELIVELDRPVRPHAGPARNPTRSTPNVPPATRSPAPSWRSPRPGRNGPACRSCSPHAGPQSPRPATPNASCARW
ncbi:hypothetical protein BJF90_32390 [Pseudonocardia sp. CNS-004]|nr:hypothetical protein BJF90_32390 [Pseudonocardia sp. CNS-004]